MEQKNGGAYYCDLACHQEENDSLQIICMAGSHYAFRLDDAVVSLVQPESNKESIPKSTMASLLLLDSYIPDHTVKEFMHGDHFNQWGLPYKFPKEFPNGVNYYIGKSNYARDWNYCHVSVPGRGGKCQSIPWNIYFNLKKKSTGTSILYVSVAVNSFTALSITINGGKNSGEVSNFKDDACVRFSVIFKTNINV
ncbi:hypothetical protein U3516DRAFT_661976 [Neocallimastix sp. 'constans']